MTGPGLPPAQVGAVLVGVAGEPWGDEALGVACHLAARLGRDLLLGHVHPRAWEVPGAGAVDAEWLAEVDAAATAALERARALVADACPDVPVRLHSHADSGAGKGLAHVAEESGASLVVLGPGRHPDPGRVSLGTTAGHLLHRSAAPVLLVPAGWPQSYAVGRVTVAVSPRGGSEAAAAYGEGLAAALGADLRRVTFLAESDHGRRGAPPTGTDAAPVRGPDVAAAVAAAGWDRGDLLVVGSSSSGVVRRAFLGDTATRILRAAPVPAVVVPRG